MSSTHSLPSTPKRARLTASQALAAFSAVRSPTSATKLRKMGSDLTTGSSITHDLDDDSSSTLSEIVLYEDSFPSPVGFDTDASSLNISSSLELLGNGKPAANTHEQHAASDLRSSFNASASSTVGKSVPLSTPLVEIAVSPTECADRFLLSHKQYFVALLPEQNYISKLHTRLGESETSCIPYELLTKQPQGIQGRLKEYQLTGLSFLIFHHRNGTGSILGDEMGLGKTVQVLSLFQHLKEHSDSDPKPHLVVCPLSVLGSWTSEVKKWAPELTILRYHGPHSERTSLKRLAKPTSKRAKVSGEAATSSYDVILTTYEVFKEDKAWFKSAFRYSTVVLDEGHKIKNSQAMISEALQSIKCDSRIILTGTPLQNDLNELWSLLHFLYPAVFTNTTAVMFRRAFDLGKGTVDQAVMEHSRKLLELIMLRRTKDDPSIGLKLPPKEEVLLFVPLSQKQRHLYLQLLTKSGKNLLDAIFKDSKKKEEEFLHADSDNGTQAARSSNTTHDQPDPVTPGSNNSDRKPTSKWRQLMNLLMQLRKCCLHPYMLADDALQEDSSADDLVASSGKFVVLKQLLHEFVVVRGKKVLIFSSFHHALDLCEQLLHIVGKGVSGFKFSRLDGSMSRARRNLSIQHLLTTHSVLLISTRAGSLGMNLTAATEIIFLDEDWNPQVTLQAEARSHRISQTQPVTIYKLCTRGTVEEQMLGRLRKKLYLSTKVMSNMDNLYTSPGETSRRRSNSFGEDNQHFDTTELLGLIRQGSQTLSLPTVNYDEMMSWNMSTMLDKCRDKPARAVTSVSASADDEARWLQTMEKVECCVFEGKKVLDAQASARRQRRKTESLFEVEFLRREDRRRSAGGNETVMVDGFPISKWSLDESEAHPKTPVRQQKIQEWQNEDHCQICLTGTGPLTKCKSCPRAVHATCLPERFKRAQGMSITFHCPQHQCYACDRRTDEAGGLLYRCRSCIRAVCEDCLDWSTATDVGENLPEYEELSYPWMIRAYYIVCATCNAWNHDDTRANVVSESFDDRSASSPPTPGTRLAYDLHDRMNLRGSTTLQRKSPTRGGPIGSSHANTNRRLLPPVELGSPPKRIKSSHPGRGNKASEEGGYM